MIDITMSIKLKRIVHRVFYTFTPKLFKNLLHIYNVFFSSTSEELTWGEWIIVLGLAFAFYYAIFYDVFIFIEDESNETSYGKYQIVYVYHKLNINYYFYNIVFIHDVFDIFRHLSLNF